VRLSSIKLSGFKSFAEPTVFQLPGQLVGVVGPNGCGKSNIMDAVRWVLGESRASELRGESMQDVIFNGSNLRRPAGRASVELVFENADHRAAGQWSQFAEIAVRRVLTRDGSSSYSINNQAVRRRDVQDVFLGTGLGPRAYAIIGQGTISRIIESKPEELRLFLEEAAGVSKYKERRRETESRLSDTRENLTRVQDILRELSVNLERLEKQAEVASRYRSLQQSATLKQQQLWLLQRQQAQREQAQLALAVSAAVNALEAGLADLRHVEAELETLRQVHYAAGDELNQAQGALYQASAEVGRLEAEIRFVVEGRQRVEQRLAQLQEQARQWQQRRALAGEQAQALAAQHAQAQQQAEAATALTNEQEQRSPALEQALREAHQRANEQRAVVTQVQQQLQLQASEQRHAQQQMQQWQQRRERLQQDRRTLAVPDEQGLQQLQAQQEAQQAQLAALQARTGEWQERVPQLDAQRRHGQQQANEESARMAHLSARLAALKTLQDKLKTDGKLRPWLLRHGLDSLAALWTRVQVQAGWENALEAVLRERLNALEVSQLERVQAFSQDAPPARLSFYALPVAASPSDPAPPGLQSLLGLLQCKDAGQQALFAHWLRGCYVADSFEAAFAQRKLLGAGEALYLPSGHAVTAHSVSFYAPDSEQAGLLARQHEIDNLDKQQRAQQLVADKARAALARAEAAHAQANQTLSTLQRERVEAQNRLHAVQVEQVRQTQLAEQARQRSTQIDTDLADIEAHIAQLQQSQHEAQARFEALDMQLADAQERHALLEERVLSAQSQLDQAREHLRTLERQAQQAQFALRSLAAQQQESERAAATATQQLHTLALDEQQAHAERAGLDDASAQAGLQSALANKLQCEHTLGTLRSRYDDLSAKLRSSDERRLRCERELEPLRRQVTERQLQEQAARLAVEQHSQLLVQATADEAAVEASIEQAGVQLHGLASEIERLNRDIQALGAVNLAALEELGSARERKQFLDAQCADLFEAITTLEDAIRKIDAETRALLGTTFEQVNLHFGQMFPELFGGGQARLVMTGDEILDSGVQVLAQPPGKKNQTIHLLSGGEKALTAIALVFAIFQLNPAPFCLLDEVDAPLDDANTERYCKLVVAMSRETQFLFISHNKIAMEMAQQLIGVTMQEQGVSRIVAVDMESAVGLVEAA